LPIFYNNGAIGAASSSSLQVVRGRKLLCQMAVRKMGYTGGWLRGFWARRRHFPQISYYFSLTPCLSGENFSLDRLGRKEYSLPCCYPSDSLVNPST